MMKNYVAYGVILSAMFSINLFGNCPGCHQNGMASKKRMNHNGMKSGNHSAGVPCSASYVKLLRAMDKLWAEHVLWTRNFVADALSDAPSTDLVTKRLLKNQDDIGNAIKPFYGAEAGKKLTELLKEHIQIAADIVKAAKAGEDFSALDKEWHRNADDIAKFLSDANPHWSFEMMRDMMYDHLKVTTQELSARLKKDWKGDIAAFDSVVMQALDMANDFAEGIAKQFPDKFQ